MLGATSSIVAYAHSQDRLTQAYLVLGLGGAECERAASPPPPRPEIRNGLQRCPFPSPSYAHHPGTHHNRCSTGVWQPCSAACAGGSHLPQSAPNTLLPSHTHPHASIHPLYALRVCGGVPSTFCDCSVPPESSSCACAPLDSAIRAHHLPPPPHFNCSRTGPRKPPKRVGYGSRRSGRRH